MLKASLTLAVLAATEAAAAQSQTGEGLPHITIPPTNPTVLHLQEFGFPTQNPTPLEDELKKRQNVQTCAFLNGDPAAPLFCSPGLACTANTQLGRAGCCPQGQACAVATACLPYMSMGFCGNSCLMDPVMIKCFNPTFPDCVTITMQLAGGTANYYDCGVAGLGGAYFAQWNPTQGSNPQPTTHAVAPGGGPATPTVTMSVGGANNQGIGGNGGNVNGNGNTVIYNSGAGGSFPTAVAVGGAWVGVLMVLLW